MTDANHADNEPAKSSIREKLASISLSDWSLWGLALTYAACAVLLVLRPAWVNVADGPVGLSYSMIIALSPLLLFILPSKDGYSITWALLLLALVLILQWRIGFGLLELNKQFFAAGSLFFIFALARRGSEINGRVGVVILMLMFFTIGPDFDIHSKELRAPGQNLTRKLNADLYTSVAYADTKFRVLDLRGSDVRGATFLRSDLSQSGVHLEGANLAGASFIDSPLNARSLKNADLTGATFEGKSCLGFDLNWLGQAKSTNLKFTCFAPPGLYNGNGEANLDGLHLLLTVPIPRLSVRAKSSRGLSFADNRIGDLRFSVNDAEGADFQNAVLPSAQFSVMRDDPSQSLFPAMKLAQAVFTGAVLTNASFHHADLRKANFSGADLRGVTFVECNLTDAIFMGAKIGWGTTEETRFLNSSTPPIESFRRWTK